jgi:hypothetical protein
MAQIQALPLPDIQAPVQPDAIPPSTNPQQPGLQVVPVPNANANDEPLRIDDSNISPLSSPETMADRASKIKYGLGDLLGKTQDEIYQNLQDGREDELRAQAAGGVDQRRQKATQGLINQVTANKGSDLSNEERDGIVEMVASLQRGTDPNTVFETAFGRQFIATLDRTAEKTPDNILSDAKKVDPEGMAKVMNDHSTLVAKREVIQTALQNAQDKYKDQGYLGWGIDLVKGLVPGYEDVKLRGRLGGVPFLTSLGLAGNLEEQRKALMRLPTDQIALVLKKLDSTLGSDNPGLHVEFLRDMLGMTSSDAFVKNMSLPMSLAGLYTGGKGGKAIGGKVFGAAETSAEKTAVKDATTAVEQMTQASTMPDVTKSSIEAAAGDLQESAITRATTNSVTDAQGTPMAQKRAVESLSATHRADMADIAANPGRFGQDIVNRIEERNNTITTQMVDAVQTVQKNERLPEVLANETVNRAIVEDMKNKYRDLRNSVIDTSPIYKEPVSNTYLLDMHIGKNDGTYFPNRTVAENFAKYHGLSDAEIVEGTNQKFTPRQVAIDKATANIDSAKKLIAKEEEKLAAATSDTQRAKSSEQIATANEYIVDQAMARIEAQKQKVTVEQQGLGYYVKVTKPVDETRPVIRQALAQTKNTQIPNSPLTNFLNSWIGKYRTPEEVLSLAERQNRLTTTYAPSSYFQIMVDNAKEIRGLQAGRFSRGRKRWVEWQDGVQRAQELPDALDADRKGYFFQSPAEMETHWQGWFHRLPDEQEIAAYFEFKRGMEIDRVFRNIAEHRNQQRVGSETHNAISYDAAGNTVKSGDFNGVVRDKVPGSADNIAIIGDKVGAEKIKALDKMSTADKAALQKDLDRGVYKLVELYNPELRELSGFGSITDERIRYILSPSMETRALNWDHVPRRGGGHVDYDYDFYIKQARIRYDDVGNRHWYEGDTTIMASPTHGIGQGVAGHLNQVRQLLKARNEEAARAYSNKNLHVDWDTVKNWFIGYKDAEGKYQPPRLSLNEDIQVVKRNTSIINQDNNLLKKYSNFRDGTREGSLARQAQVEFNQERDAFELLGVNVEGTRANPLYKVAPATKVDAVTMMNRGLQRIARSSFMDDYKTMAVEHWLAQAANHLDAHTIQEIYNSPHYFFNEGKFLSSTPPEVRARLEASRYHTQQITGQPSVTDALLHSAAQKLADFSFQSFGPKGLVITPTWLLPKLKDPFGFLRSVAFNVKLGLFNIPQFIVQAGNYANIFGIAGAKFAAPGTLGAQLHFWSTVNRHPAIIDALDRLASKMTLPGSAAWKPGEFKEAFSELHKTGFGRAGGEYAALDNMSTKVVNTGFGQILDWGRMPFKAGEENARYGAWYTAFKEFRETNPTGRITNEDRAKILQRADLLNVNMSRASSSAIHKGIWSVPTQFYTYQIRLTELMFGSRLTGKERARLFATNAALFGLPMAAGTTSLPIADYLRKKALENDYVVGDDYMTSMLMEGVPAAMLAMITGKGDPSKGTWYDVGPRFGTKGLEFLGSATGSDKGWLDVLGGPVYSIAKDTIAQSDGLARAMISMARGDGEVFPMVAEDVADVAKEITSFNSAWRVYAATQWGRWVSKKDAYLSDASPAQAIFGALFGVKDTNIDDITLKNQSLKDQKQYEDKVEEQFRQEFRRGVLSQKDEDFDAAKRYFTRAQAWLAIGGYREDRINSLVSKALGENQSILDKTNFDFYIRKAPDKAKDGHLGAFQRTYKIQEGKQE